MKRVIIMTVLIIVLAAAMAVAFVFNVKPVSF
jgi:hypothetical protein